MTICFTFQAKSCTLNQQNNKDIRYGRHSPQSTKPTRFMDQFRVFIRCKQLAYKTEKTYCMWVIDFIRFHGIQHPRDMGGLQLDEYLSYLAVKRNLAINSQKTALNALVFIFYHE